MEFFCAVVNWGSCTPWLEDRTVRIAFVLGTVDPMTALPNEDIVIDVMALFDETLIAVKAADDGVELPITTLSIVPLVTVILPLNGIPLEMIVLRLLIALMPCWSAVTTESMLAIRAALPVRRDIEPHPCATIRYRHRFES